jgi:hypothetical protein
MRVLKIVAVAAISLFAATAVATAQDKGGAAGALPLVTALPSPKHDEQQILFALKANGISQELTPQQFCSKMDYGNAVIYGEPASEIKEEKVVKVISWVICRFSNTSN